MICCNIFTSYIIYPLFVLTLYSVPFKWVLLSTNISCECLSLQFQSLIFQWLLQMLSANQMFSHFDCVLQKNIMTLNYENKNFLTIRRILIVTQWVTSILQTTMKTLLEVIDFGGLSMSDFFIKFFGWCIFIFKKCIHLYWNKDIFHMHYLLSSMGFFSLIQKTRFVLLRLPLYKIKMLVNFVTPRVIIQRNYE